MSVGNEQFRSCCRSPEQREFSITEFDEIRRTKPIFGYGFPKRRRICGRLHCRPGRRYLHINANGNVDPCVFVHYSNANIRENTLLECLQSPIFMAYHDGQPFNNNHLRPCPMLENPELLREIVQRTNADSTDLQSPESVDHLCDKCVEYASAWTPVAEKLWEDRSYGGIRCRK